MTVDALRTDAELRIFDDVVEFLEARGIRWWLDQGSALGAIREQRFLPWDHDVDVAAPAEAVEPHKDALVLDMHRRGYRVKELGSSVHVAAPWGMHASMVDLTLYVFSDGVARCQLEHLPPGRRPGALAVRAARAPISVLHRAVEFLARRSVHRGRLHTRLRRFARTVQGARTRLTTQTTLAVDASYFDELTIVDANRRRLPVPSPPEAYMELKYGADWRTPKRAWAFWEDDGAIQPSS